MLEEPSAPLSRRKGVFTMQIEGNDEAVFVVLSFEV